MTAPERDAALARLTLTTEMSDLAGCDLVVEAVIEDLAAKEEVFRELDAVLRGDAIVATNTSALSVTRVAAASTRPDRVVGLHFFNPAPVMPLVEVVRTKLTSELAFAAAFGLVERIGKTPIACGDTPGFVVNRILIPVLNDAVRVLDEGTASLEDLDRAMCLGNLADRPAGARGPDRRGRARPRRGGSLGGVPGAPLRAAAATGQDAGGRAPGP